jgi:signal transduction histidine kinase
MMILIGVLPIVILGSLALYSLNLTHRLDVASIETNLINQKTEQVSEFFNDITSAFDLRVAFEQTSDIEINQQHFLLQQLLTENPSLEEVAFASLSGKETSKYDRVHTGTVPEDELIDQSRIGKFIKAREGNVFISPVYLTLKGPMISVASPVRNRNGIIISVLIGKINLNGIVGVIKEAKLGSSGYVYVVDQDGYLLTTSRPGTYSATLNLGRIGFISRLIAGEAFLDAEKQARYASFWNEKVVAAGNSVKNYGVSVVAEWPTADADQIVNTITSQIIIISIFVLLMGVILSLFLANRIVRPIKALEDGTKLIAEGKFNQPVTIVTHDELEDLGLAFNKMMEGLKRLEELKNEFVFIAAHELRTPVTAIKGYISMVVERASGGLDEESKRFLGEVKKASERLNNLVNDLLQIARSEAGRLEIKVSPVDAVEPAKSAVNELKVLADEKAIRVVFEPVGLPLVMADPARLKEIIINLVGNAIKYTLNGGTVTVSQEVVGRELVTRIKDTGIGIAPADQQKLFEKFYRVQTEKTRQIIGTGLGLFIVKQMIDRMSGRIWVESEENKGSTFSFVLPLAS